MKESLQEFTKKKEFLVCIDSDGCVMDTMNVKHMRCFGPCLVYEWGLGEFRDEIIGLWRRVNLLSAERGINRFSGLATVLSAIEDNYMRVEGLEDYLEWACTTDELSAESLLKAYEEKGTPCLKKALEWTDLVNQSMKIASDNTKQPFEGAEEALQLTCESADVAIVTAAVGQEIIHEWETCNLYHYVDLLVSQETGTKSECLKALLAKGYDPDHVLMIGDAPADLAAAQDAGVLFYPILAYKERNSWHNFPQALKRFLEGTFAGEYQNTKIALFKKNLHIEP